MEKVVIGNATLYLGDCMDVLPTIGKVDAVITDPPYSKRTHQGHDASANGHIGENKDGADRKVLGYAAWDSADVITFMKNSAPKCKGWMVCMTDHTLAPVWQEQMEAEKRYTFAPLPYFAPGSRVRLSGDGPSSWTIWIIVSRTAAQARWGTLRGGYLHQPGWGASEYMGGKPVGLMAAILKDYTKEGNTVLDPCMGSGTTGVACMNLDRNFIGIEINRESFDIACERIDRAQQQLKLAL